VSLNAVVSHLNDDNDNELEQGRTSNRWKLLSLVYLLGKIRLVWVAQADLGRCLREKEFLC
jgi:hypothetical protein